MALMITAQFSLDIPYCKSPNCGASYCLGHPQPFSCPCSFHGEFIIFYCNESIDYLGRSYNFYNIEFLIYKNTTIVKSFTIFLNILSFHCKCFEQLFLSGCESYLICLKELPSDPI